jgi:choline dehydrogenase-like flavoprotein
MTDHYDIIVIGSGPGGASAAQRLAPTGKRILMLERGDYLPRSQQNWDAKAVFVDGFYQTKKTWYGADGRTFHPGLHYFVGGNSKVYGAALFRLRERDLKMADHSIDFWLQSEDLPAPTRPVRYWSWTARRMSWTTCISRMPASFPRSAR